MGWSLMPTRAVTVDQVARMKALRANGLTAPAIGLQLGIPASTVRNWWNAGACVDCGSPTGRSCGVPAKRCNYCRKSFEQSDAYRASVTVWTRERIVERIRWWVETFGEPSAITDWSPTHARDDRDFEKARLGEELIATGEIPWFMSVVNRFGSWNAGIAAAGFTPRAPGATRENASRTRLARRAREPEAMPTTKETGSSVA